MARTVSPPKSLAVSRRFEPNRLAPEYLVVAYARLVPLSHRSLGITPFVPPRRAADESRRKEAA